MPDPASILGIDDEAGIRAGCRGALEPAGYTVLPAETLDKGEERLRQSSIELALLEIMVPDGSGIHFLETIQAQDADGVTVINTGYATVELAVTATKRGPYDFISNLFFRR
jgi:DNA-binding NtrC family response regulator